jgi:esterase/lipase
MAGSANTPAVAAETRMAATYDEAIARVTALQALDGPEVRAGSQTRLWTHGHQAERALVYYHGYTNAPQQFDLLGEQLFQLGYNVLVPRLPYHGLEDRMNTDQGKLTADDLLKMTRETVDLMHGLGQKVTVAGLSGGGVMAAWAAQFRSDVDLAVVIGPAFGLPFAPAWVSTWMRNLAPHLPNLYIWWDPRKKDKIEGPVHGYPRFSTQGLAQIFRFGKLVMDAAKTTRPAASHIQMITSAFDAAIHLPTAHKVTEEWKEHGADVLAYEFPKDMKIWHDMIDPAQATQRIDVVYPVLIKMITEGIAPA